MTLIGEWSDPATAPSRPTRMVITNTGRALPERCPARMAIRYLLIVFTLLLFARQSDADVAVLRVVAVILRVNKQKLL